MEIQDKSKKRTCKDVITDRIKNFNIAKSIYERIKIFEIIRILVQPYNTNKAFLNYFCLQSQ